MNGTTIIFKRLCLVTSILFAVFFMDCNQNHAAERKEAFPDEPAKATDRQEESREFLNCRIVPRLGNTWDYTFEPGEFPKLEWDKPYLVEKVMEMAGGKSIFRLMRENLFDPLGLKNTTLEEDLE